MRSRVWSSKPLVPWIATWAGSRCSPTADATSRKAFEGITKKRTGTSRTASTRSWVIRIVRGSIRPGRYRVFFRDLRIAAAFFLSRTHRVTG